MNDELTTYRIDLTNPDLPTGSYLANDSELVSYLKNRDVLVPDTRLQAIANAWNYDDIGQGRYEFRQQWSELAVLLDALKEDNDE